MYPPSIPLPMKRDSQNVAEYLLEGKEESRQALLTLQGGHSYGELCSASIGVARYLLAAGGIKGDRVLLVSENTFFWVAAYWGILRAGLVCVPLPPTTSRQDLDYILETTEARFAFLQARFAAKHAPRFGEINCVTDSGLPRRDGLPPQPGLRQLEDNAQSSQNSSPPIQGSDLAALMFTSGSTGKPRGVMVSHTNIRANTESIIHCLRLKSDDRMLTVLPFHYCFGTSLLHTHLRVGGTLVLDSRFMYPEKVLQRMQETECTGFAGVPSHFQILLRNSSLREKTFPHLRYVQQAGGHLAPAFIKELREALPEAQIFIMYGQTEATARLSCLTPELLDRKLGSVGQGIPGVKLRVVDKFGLTVQPGEVGELLAEGENVTLGYWREPEETATAFRNGALHTGDLAMADEDGFIYIVDRAKDFVKCGGRRISCRQIEDQLLEYHDLLEVAVLPIPDDVLGEGVKAFVVPRSPNSKGLKDRLYHFCRNKMPSQLVPREIVMVQAIPKNSAGKVLKLKLKDG